MMLQGTPKPWRSAAAVRAYTALVHLNAVSGEKCDVLVSGNKSLDRQRTRLCVHGIVAKSQRMKKIGHRRLAERDAMQP